jgi:hypothetical protein
VVDYALRFQQLLVDFFERRAGDYQTLLAYGRVWRDDVEDREGWRREIRAQARRDRLRVRTWCGDQDGVVGAMMDPDVRDPAVYRAEIERFRLLDEVTMELTLQRGHSLRWVRRGDESVAFCPQCGGRVYLRTSAPLVRDGDAFQRSCDQHAVAVG